MTGEDREISGYDPRARHAALWATLVGVAILLILLAWPSLQDRFYAFDDVGNFYVPMKALYARALGIGQIPFWTHELFAGFYLHGEGQLGMLHPWNLALYGTLSYPGSLMVDLLVRYPLGMLGMYWFLRRWKLSKGAAAFGGATFAFCGFQMLHYPHLNFVQITQHLPWVLGAADMALSERPSTRRGGWVLLAVLTASHLLLGYYAASVFCLIGAVVYVVVVGRLRLTHCWRVLSALVVGVLMASIQLMPVYEQLKVSSRPTADATFLLNGSLHPANLVHLLSPLFFDGGAFIDGETTFHEQIISSGTVPLLLMFVGLTRQGSPDALRRLRIFAVVLIVVGFTIALGRHSWVARMYFRSPVLGWFRIPARYIFLVQTGVSILSALGLETLWNARHRGRSFPRVFWAMLAMAAVACLVGFVVKDRADLWNDQAARHHLSGAPLIKSTNLLAGLALVAVAVAITSAAWHRVPSSIVVLVVFSLFDQTWRPIRNLMLGGTRTIAGLTRDVELPEQALGQRVYRELANDTLLVGAENLSGYASLRPKRALEPWTAEGLRVAGVRWFCPENHRVWRETDPPLPYARLASECRTPGDVRKTLATIDPERVALVEGAPSLDGGSPGTARLIEKGNGSIVVDTNAPATRFLVVSESASTGWRVEIDGVPGQVKHAYGDFIGCVVPAGTHRVAFHFDPPGLRTGMAFSALGGGFLIVFMVWPFLLPARRASA